MALQKQVLARNELAPRDLGHTYVKDMTGPDMDIMGKISNLMMGTRLLGGDKKNMGGKMGFTANEINGFCSNIRSDPTEQMIMTWGSKKMEKDNGNLDFPIVYDLIRVFKEIRRDDVVEIIQMWINQALC